MSLILVSTTSEFLYPNTETLYKFSYYVQRTEIQSEQKVNLKIWSLILVSTTSEFLYPNTKTLYRFRYYVQRTEIQSEQKVNLKI